MPIHLNDHPQTRPADEVEPRVRALHRLADQWPGTHFEVHGHGNDRTHILWTDGPGPDAVRDLLAPTWRREDAAAPREPLRLDRALTGRAVLLAVLRAHRAGVDLTDPYHDDEYDAWDDDDDWDDEGTDHASVDPIAVLDATDVSDATAEEEQQIQALSAAAGLAADTVVRAALTRTSWELARTVAAVAAVADAPPHPGTDAPTSPEGGTPAPADPDTSTSTGEAAAGQADDPRPPAGRPTERGGKRRAPRRGLRSLFDRRGDR